MSSWRTLNDLRGLVLDELDIEDWITPSQLCDRHGLGHGRDWLRVSLLCERLAHEGLAELQNPASRGKRYFRRIA